MVRLPARGGAADGDGLTPPPGSSADPTPPAVAAAATPAAGTRAARRVLARGIVQGVGFRPFVHRLASQLGLSGSVRNVAGTVEIEIEGPPASLALFEAALRRELPPLARLDALHGDAVPAVGREGFVILPSTDADGDRPVPADVALCEACAREVDDPGDRRHRYPFTTCTDCGPRYTVIAALPYDRERTTLRAFPLCAACAREYQTPGDRRHHAESIACPTCGPHVWFERSGDATALATGDAALAAAAAALRDGQVLALRGLGGFHLVCDATDAAAVEGLRGRKHRDAKPLAVMVADEAEARRIADPTDAELACLRRPDRAIVLMRRRRDGALAPAVAPGLGHVGVMLAYTPLHRLLLQGVERPLVMTSGNLSDEPIAIGNDEARARLAGIADAFLLHDREILSRCDDSVVRLSGARPVLLRRGRGHAPAPHPLPVAAPRPLLAVGPHLKNTFCLARGAQAYVSPHIGDLEGLETVAHWREALARYQSLFRITPEVVVRDQHAGYLSTRLADELGLPVIAVQHHHAHIAAVLAEHGEAGPAVGLAFDGTGAGDDGTVWGAEVLVADLRGYTRVAHLRPAPLPGGDAAARQPWRAALGYLTLRPDAANAFALAAAHVGSAERRVVEQQLARAVNAPLASSMGRLFDAAAAVLGLRHVSAYEGQAAMELEAAASSWGGGGDGNPGAVELPVAEVSGREVLDPLPLLMALGARAQRRESLAALAVVFHESVAQAAAQAAERAARRHALTTVALGGGSWQNAWLLERTVVLLEGAGLRVLVPRVFSPNDGAIAYGQAAVGAARLAAQREAGAG